MIETENLDKKSLLCFARLPEKIGWKDLAKDCVAFANTRGGDLLFGIEDSESEPDPDQRIALGLVAQHGSLTALEFSRILDLKNEDTRIRSWLSNLESREIILSKGKTRGKTYFVNPEVLRTMDFKGKTTLKNIESHRLRELLLMDLKTYGPTLAEAQRIDLIHERVGSEISRRQLKDAIDRLREGGLVEAVGEKRGMAYHLSAKGASGFNPESVANNP